MDTQSGATNENTTVFLELPSNRHYTRKQLTIEIGAGVLGLIRKLAIGPYHRLQDRSSPIIRSIPMPGDTGSDLLALAYALGYVKAVGGQATHNRELLEAARARIEGLSQRRTRTVGGIGSASPPNMGRR